MQGDKAVPSTNARSRSASRKGHRDAAQERVRGSCIARKKWRKEREREREKSSNHTALIEIHLRPPFVFAPPFLSISFMCYPRTRMCKVFEARRAGELRVYPVRNTDAYTRARTRAFCNCALLRVTMIRIRERSRLLVRKR